MVVRVWGKESKQNIIQHTHTHQYEPINTILEESL